MSSCSRRRAEGRAPRLAALLLAVIVPQTAWGASAADAAGQLTVAAVVPSTVDRQVSLVASVSPAPAAAPRPEDFAVSVDDAPVPSVAAPVLSDRLALAVVVDGSAAGSPALQGAVSGATDLLLQLPTSVRSAAVVDRNPPAVPAPLTEGPTDAVGALSAVRSGGERRTAEALTLAEGQLPRDGAPRVVVLATGAADAGGEPAAELGRRLRAARVLLAVVGTGPDQGYWAQVAGETGGLVVDGRGSPPTAAFEAVATGLRGRYLVTFGLPERLPARVTVRLDTARGPLSAAAEVPAPVTTPAPPPPGGSRGAVGALLLVLALVAGVGVLVGIRRRRARSAASTPPESARPASAPPASARSASAPPASAPPESARSASARPASAPPESAPPASALPASAPPPRPAAPVRRRDPAASPINGIPTPASPGDRPVSPPGSDRSGGPPSPADALPGDRQVSSPESNESLGSRPLADAPPGDQPAPGAARTVGDDESAYRHLDSEVGLVAIAVEARRLDVRRAVARIAMAAPGRPDLLDRVVDTERRIAGARLGASPSTATVLDLLAAARRVVTGEATLVGPDGARVEYAGRRLRLSRDGEPARDFDSVAELARHVDLAALAEEPSLR